MFARLTWLRFKPNRSDEGFGVVAQSIVPTIKEQPGCDGVLLLRDEHGDAATLTFWASDADMAEAARGNYPVQIKKVDGMLRQPPSRHTFEVVDMSFGPDMARHPPGSESTGQETTPAS